jgi:NAD(P)-dependent dehydrogenase (short-subunit alcohol dehydrogenase family)
MAFAAAYHHVPAPAYKISKATLNALTVQYALDYEKDGFSFMAITPGVSSIPPRLVSACSLRTDVFDKVDEDRTCRWRYRRLET